MNQSTFAVTERALLGRLNRKLAHDDLRVKTCRWDARGYHDLGRHYIINTRWNAIDTKDIDVEAWGRELGCLSDFEVLANEEVAQ